MEKAKALAKQYARKGGRESETKTSIGVNLGAACMSRKTNERRARVLKQDGTRER